MDMIKLHGTASILQRLVYNLEALADGLDITLTLKQVDKYNLALDHVHEILRSKQQAIENYEEIPA